MVGLVLVVLVGVVASLMVRTSPADAAVPVAHRLGRQLQYLFLLIAVFSAASGLARVLAAALPIGRRIAGPGPEQLALGLSLTLVFVPLWTVLWRSLRRRLSVDPAERAAREWPAYLALVTATALLFALVAAVRIGAWALAAGDLDADAVATAVVWGAVWALHVRLLGHPALAPTATRPSIAVLAGSAIGVVAFALGVDGLLSYGLAQVYRALADGALVEGATTVALRESLVLTVLAAGVWWWHWLRQAVHGPRSTPWHVYVLLVPVLGGLLVAVVFAAVVVHAVLQWVIGDPDATRAAVHFTVLPEALAATAVAGWVWCYHLTVVAHGAQRQRDEPERIYEYVVAAVGLVAAAVGATTAIVAVIQAVAPAPLAAADPLGRNTIVVASTLLLVGAPLWWSFWRRAQRRAGVDGAAEVRSSARRGYLFVLFGVAGLVAAISLVVILFVVLRDLFAGTLGATVVHELRVAIALVLTTGGVSAYHWAVHTEDRAARPEAERRPPRHVVLASAEGRTLADAVAARTGATVRPLRRLDAAPGAPDAEAIAAAILASPHERLLVTVDDDGTVHAIPYETV